MVVMVHTSRLYKILLREREEEEKRSYTKSVFKIVKEILHRRPCVDKSEIKSKLSKTEQIIQKVRKRVNPTKPGAYQQKHHRKKLAPDQDSAYFSVSQSSFNSSNVNEISIESDDSSASFDQINPPSTHPSITPSYNPILVRSTNVHKPPKKNVTILLPFTKRWEKPFGIRLQLERTGISHSGLTPRNVHVGNVSSQVIQIYSNTKSEMMDKFPSLSTTINLLFSFQTRPLLLSLSSSMMGDLLFQLWSVLISPLLLRMQTFDVVLFIFIKLLQNVFLPLQSGEKCSYFHSRLADLYEKCEKYVCQHQVECLAEVRLLYVDIWCCLVGEL